MYCQTCGIECQPGLNFCNRCGTPVNVAVSVRQEVVPVDLRSPMRTLGVTITLTTLIGLAILFIGLNGLATWHIETDALAAIGIFSLFFLLGVELSLIRLMTRLLGVAPEKRRLTLPFGKQAGTKELYGAPQYASPLPEGVPSVTEHTTRTFSPAYREPRT